MKAPSFLRRGGLFAKYFLSLVGIVTLVLLINGAFDMWFAYGTARQALGRLQQEQANGAADKVGQFITEIERQIGWTTHPQWAAAPVDQRRFDFIRLQRQVPAITELTQIDGQGREQLKVSRLAMDAVGTNTDLSKDPRFTEVQNKRVWYSPVYLRKESEPYMSISLARTGRRAGATAAEVNLKLIWDVVSAIKAGAKGYAYVVDRDGRLIAHPDISLVLRNTNMSKLEQVHTALDALRDGKPLAGDSARFGHALDGTAVLSSVAAIPALGWLVFVEQPTSEALQPLFTSLWQTMALLVLGLATAALGAWFLSRRMASPIRVLSAGAERLGGGDLGHRIEVRTGDEVEALATNFNRMAGQLEESHATLEQRVVDRTRELTETLEQQTATAEILRVISQSPTDVQPVLNVVASSARRFCGATDAVIVLRDDTDIAVAAHDGPLPTPASRFPLDRSSFSGRAMIDGRTIYVGDVGSVDPVEYGTALELARGAEYRATLATPMMREGTAIGSIVLRRANAGEFTPRQVELLETFAAQAVIAISNVRLFTELSETLEQQKAAADILSVISKSVDDAQPVFAKILESCRHLFGGDELDVLLVDEQGQLTIAAYLGESHDAVAATFPAPVERTPAGRAIRERRVVHWPDLVNGKDVPGVLRKMAQVVGYRSMAFAPMLWEGRGIGAIGVARSTGSFKPKELEMLQTFADQAAIAIQNARLFTELRESLEQQTATAEILRVISQSPTDVQPVLEAVAKAAVRFCGATDAIITLREGDGAILAAHEGPLTAVAGSSLPLNRETAPGRAVLDGQTCHLPDIASLDPAEFAAAHRLASAGGFRAAVAAPLLRKGIAIGSVALRKPEPGAFTARQIALLETFAAQAVIAIENVRLFTEIQDKSRQLEVASQHKSQFLANMSHELRTPLNAIIGYTEMMADGLYGDVGEKAAGVLERVQNNGRHLLGLINDVLDLSKIEAGQLSLTVEPYSVTDMVATVLSATESLARTKGIGLGSAVAPGLPTGTGDARRLTQVLLNLVGNAIKFTDQGSVEVRAAQAGDRFELSVVDTGLGIAPADQARVFEEFQQVDNTSTRKKGGTGLGLSISRKIVELHGGRISVESEVGKGSTFKVSVPVNVAPMKDAAE